MDKSLRALDTLYDVNFLLHDLQCIGWGNLAKGLLGAGQGVHAGSPDSSHFPEQVCVIDVTESNALHFNVLRPDYLRCGSR